MIKPLIYDVSKKAKDCIDNYNSIQNESFVYFDFDFKPLEKQKVKIKK